jgi:16S rRNA (cytidine1402-2'-O)-methyltransferase
MPVFTIAGREIEAGRLASGLYIVATPIGNLADVTLRALAVLAAADVVACEDKRISTRLLNRYAIRSELLVYHEHNADKTGPLLIDRLRSGNSVALISDAGTPLISDPGYRLANAAREAGIAVVPVPGPSAAIAALSASGLPTDTFLFGGFLPARRGARVARLEELSRLPATLIFYESPKRLGSALADMSSAFGADRRACVFREITKMHEESVVAPLGELAEHFGDAAVRGEIVVLVEPASKLPAEDPDELLRQLLAEMSVSRAAAAAAAITGLSRRELYQRALMLSRQTGRE